MSQRVLGPGDAEALEDFLRGYRDSSMFLRSNLRKGGIVYQGEAFQAVYVGAFDAGELRGVVAHSWSGILMMQAPVEVEALALACVAASGRAVTGLNGDLEQVQRARAALGLLDVATRKDAHDGLYALQLEDLRVPPALASGELSTRPPLPLERQQLIDWRTAYDIELLGGDDTPDTRERATGFLDWQWADGNLCVAVLGEQIVSLSAFNATLPEIVQLGGIYTPPELRGRGYARVAVTGSLRVALARGASRAVLFSNNPSAIRSYESVGFRRIGDYALVILR